jgi:DNA-directed RNA polymerase subunit A"
MTTGNNSILNLDQDYLILSVSKDEKVSWSKIVQLSRHPANGQLIKIKTKSGKTTTATLSHSFLKRNETEIVPIKGSDLRVGDRVPVARNIPTIENPITTINIADVVYNLDARAGILCGRYIATSEINDSSFVPLLEKYFSNHKTIPGFVFTTNKDFIVGLIRGYFDCQVSINQHLTCTTSDETIDGLCLLLSYCGIFASKNDNILQILKEDIPTFKNTIGLSSKSQMALLDDLMRSAYNDSIDKIPTLEKTITEIETILSYKIDTTFKDIERSLLMEYIKAYKQHSLAIGNINTRKKVDQLITNLEQAAFSDVVWDEIVEITILEDPQKNVYDFTVLGNNTFMVDCGILVHNTLNSVDWEERVFIEEDGRIITEEVGKYIDDKVKLGENVTRLEDSDKNEMGDTYYVDTSNKNIFTVSTNKDGQISWSKVTALTKHLPINKDGTTNLI